MNAVSGTRRAIKELADGTIRVQVDIDPQYRADFFRMFPEIDSAVALAPLVDDFDRQPVEIQPEPGVVEPDPMTDRPKGGPLAKLAGILCADPAFQEWLAKEYESLWNVAVKLTGEDGADGEFVAAWIVRHICDVESRAMLDHAPGAAQDFHDKIRKPWMESQ